MKSPRKKAPEIAALVAIGLGSIGAALAATLDPWETEPASSVERSARARPLAAQASSLSQPTTIGSVVALGDSLLAGFSAGGLVETVQKESVPALLAAGLAQIGAPLGAFEQPLFSEPGLPPLLEVVSTSPLVIAPRAGTSTPLNADLDRAFDNLAVPGARVNDALNTTSGGFFEHVLRGRGTMVAQALSHDADLALVWLGNGDALSAVTSGIAIEGVTLTARASFGADLRAVVTALRNQGKQVVLLELPRFEQIPYLTYLPTVVHDVTSKEPVLVGGQTIPLIGPDGPLSADDRVLLHAASAIAAGVGVPVAQGGTGQPLSNASVLTAAERLAALARLAELNEEIRAAAADLGAILAPGPARAYELAAQDWRRSSCPHDNPAQPFGSFFSLDAVHPTRAGYAAIANALFADLGGAPGERLPLSDEEACLGSAPFAVSVRWATPSGETGVAHPVHISADTASFWFFQPTNVELIMKVLDACSFDNAYWVFAGGLTNVNVEITVVDTRNDTTVTYTNPQGTAFAPIQDTSALRTCP